jgi:hypothetical protein
MDELNFSANRRLATQYYKTLSPETFQHLAHPILPMLLCQLITNCLFFINNSMALSDYCLKENASYLTDTSSQLDAFAISISRRQPRLEQLGNEYPHRGPMPRLDFFFQRLDLFVRDIQSLIVEMDRAVAESLESPKECRCLKCIDECVCQWCEEE